MNNKNDLTTGVIWKKMLVYFLPLAVGTIFQQLYSAVDGVVVGKFVGTVALAAVGGSASLISSALINFFVSLTGGGSVLIAQFFGANNREALNKSVHTSMLFSLVCGIVISIVGYIFTPQMLVWMDTPADSMPDSIVYLRIIFEGVVFQMVYNMAAGVLRAVGDSRSPFIYLTISCVLNIVLDILAVCTLKMGVAGAAYATILSQAICCIIVVAKLFRLKNESYGMRFKDLKVDWKILGRVLAVGVPMALQSMMYSVTNLIIQAKLNSLGTAIVAAWALTSKTDGFFWGLMTAASVTISNFTGQNFGKRDFERIKKGVGTSFILFMSIAVIFSVGLLTCTKFMFPWFTDDDEVVFYACKIVTYFAPYYVIWVVNEVFSGVMRGEGKTLAAFIITAIGICVVRIIWLYTVFAIYPTLLILSIVYPISWTVCGIAMTIYYFSQMNKKKG